MDSNSPAAAAAAAAAPPLPQNPIQAMRDKPRERRRNAKAQSHILQTKAVKLIAGTVVDDAVKRESMAGKVLEIENQIDRVQLRKRKIRDGLQEAVEQLLEIKQEIREGMDLIRKNVKKGSETEKMFMNLKDGSKKLNGIVKMVEDGLGQFKTI